MLRPHKAEKVSEAWPGPVQATPAVTHGATKTLSPLCIQTVLWNIVDSTVGVLPVTNVDAAVDALSPAFRNALNTAGSPQLSKILYNTVYDSKAMEGLPVGVQLVAPAYEEERVIEMMKVVDAALLVQRGGPFKLAAYKAYRMY